MKHPRSVSTPQILKAQLQVFSKEDFNYKRNNSILMSTCLSWNSQDQQDNIVEDQRTHIRYVNQSGRQSENYQDGRRGQQTHQFDNRNVGQKPVNAQQPQSSQRAKSALKPHSRAKGSSNAKPKVDYSKYQKSQQQLLQQKRKQQQRHQKIQVYIDSMVPYSRTLTNSKFQQFYQKSAPQVYGCNNLTQPIGGLVYGNNYRTFNVNPHDYQNNPKYYQSYQTSLNFAARCKRNEQKHWKRLEKELGKKLNLHQKNHTLQQGKQIIYVDVNDQNMYGIMRQNLQFKKEHRDQIKDSEKDFQHQKQMKSLAEKQKFYRNKAQRIEKTLQTTQASMDKVNASIDRSQGDRIRQQVIFKHHDKDGNVRIGADRHALTCFVDINFPQNDKLYTEELKGRMPIYQTQVKDCHKNIAFKKHQNYQKSITNNIYPSHYLVPCSQQPQIQKMLIEKGKEKRQPSRK